MYDLVYFGFIYLSSMYLYGIVCGVGIVVIYNVILFLMVRVWQHVTSSLSRGHVTRQRGAVIINSQ